MNNLKKTVIHILPFFAIAFFEMFFFRNMLGNDKLFSDSADGRLTMLLTEHWFRFFCGKERFADTLMFFPAKGTMGYSDMFLGYGLVHSIFRAIGLDVYQAFKCTLIALHIFGSVTMFLLCRRELKLPLFWSFLALLSFSYSSVFADIGFGHTQLSTVNFMPLFAISFARIVRFWENRKKRNASITAFILSYFLILYTGWYIAFFAALFCLVLVITYIAQIHSIKLPIKEKAHKILLDLRWDAILFVLLTVALFIPFCCIYLPVLKAGGGYGYEWQSLPDIAGLINVTERNMIFGKIIRRLGIRNFEATGFPVIVLIFFFGSFRLFEKTKATVKDYENAFVKSFFTSIIVCILLCLKLSDGGLSLWMLVYKFIPGAKSIRGIGRFLFFLSFPISLSIALCGSICHGNFRGLKKTAPSLSILVLLFISQITRGGVGTGWNRNSALRFREEVPEPPKDARTFFILPKEGDSRDNAFKQLDAYDIACLYDIPTLNGYSGNEPRNWHGIWNVGSNDYERALFFWILANDELDDGVYSYDPNKKLWEAYNPKGVIKELYAPRVYSFTGNNIKAGYDVDGNRFLEPNGRSYGPYWTVLPGSYKVIIEGDGLYQAQIEVYSHFGEVQYPFTSNISDTKIELKFSIPKATSNFEVLVKNESEKIMTLSSFVLTTEKEGLP